jgi:two-component sensor histidine kinase
MVIHELVPNAAKHERAVGHGRQSVGEPGLHQRHRAAILTITWRELGGSPITAPVQFGYGLSLIRDLVPHELRVPST